MNYTFSSLCIAHLSWILLVVELCGWMWLDVCCGLFSGVCRLTDPELSQCFFPSDTSISWTFAVTNDDGCWKYPSLLLFLKIHKVTILRRKATTHALKVHICILPLNLFILFAGCIVAKALMAGGSGHSLFVSVLLFSETLYLTVTASAHFGHLATLHAQDLPYP